MITCDSTGTSSPIDVMEWVTTAVQNCNSITWPLVFLQSSNYCCHLKGGRILCWHSCSRLQALHFMAAVDCYDISWDVLTPLMPDIREVMKLIILCRSAWNEKFSLIRDLTTSTSIIYIEVLSNTTFIVCIHLEWYFLGLPV